MSAGHCTVKKIIFFDMRIVCALHIVFEEALPYKKQILAKWIGRKKLDEYTCTWAEYIYQAIY
jgi:hypothetical protein